MPAESKHKSGTSGRYVTCAVFLVGLIAVAGLAISIVTLVKQLKNDDDVTPTVVTMHQGQGQVTSPSINTPSPIPDPRTDAVVECYPDRNYLRAECEKAGYAGKYFITPI